MARDEQKDGETTAEGPPLESTARRWTPGAVIAGRYRLERVIGEGGMGVVWEATHSITRKPVALKLLLTEARSTRARKRFLREARAAAAVRHPNVIDIYDVLELDDGALTIVMELLSGAPLAARLAPSRRLPLREAAAILLQVAAAVGEAHTLGIIHRDLKPENIFLISGPTARVKVLDFGIAKLTAAAGAAARTMALTETGTILGTPRYIAPEQVRGEQEIDHRADIWALGLVLYQCLSGVLPTDGDSLIQILTFIAMGTIRPLAAQAPDVPAEIAALVDRMLARRREERPSDLREVAEILARYAGVPAPHIGPPLAPQGLLSEPPPPTEQPSVPPAETDSRVATTADVLATQAAAIEPMMASLSACLAIAFRPDGVLVATAHDNGIAYLWDAATGVALRALRGHTGAIYSLAISPDGDHVITGSADTTVRLWDIVTGRCLSVFEGHSNPVRSVAITPDGQTIVSADGAGVLLSPRAGGPASRVIKDPKALLYSVAIRPDGRVIATGAPHGVISLWEAATGELIAEWRSVRARLHALAFHPSGQILASCGDNAVRLWGVDSGHVLHVLQGHTAQVRGIAFSPDGEMLVSGSQDKTLRSWDIVTGKLMSVLGEDTAAVHSVAFRPDGRVLASGGDDRGLTLRDLPAGRARRVPRALSALLHGVALSPDGETIASGVEDGSIALWKTRTGQLQRVFNVGRGSAKALSGPPRSLAVSPDGQILAASTGDVAITLYALATGQVKRTLQRSAGAVRSLAISPDGKTLAAGADDATITLWDMSSGREAQAWKGSGGAVRSLAFSPDGETLAAGAEDRTVRLFSRASAEARLCLRGPSIALGLAYRRDGGALRAGGEDASITVWETTRGQVLRSVSGQGPQRVSAAFSADLRLLVSVGRDGALSIADAGTGASHATLIKLADGWVAFTPDGHYKLEGRADGVFWHVNGLDRFEPGELDQHLPSPLRLADDAPILP